MPNWCSNTLEIAHEDPAMLKRAVDAFGRGELLNEFIPVPSPLRIAASPGTQDADLNALYEINIQNHGYANWYDFCVAEWGTKWDIGGDDCESVTLEPGQTDTTLCFESAWSPPCDAYAKLVELGFSIRAYYYEPGMAFAGIWDNGDDQFYDYSNMSSEQAKEELPEVLDDMFGISEAMAEYESEEESSED